MRGRLACGLACAAIATAAPAKRPPPPAFAEPGDIIAAEGAFAHLGAAKGLKAAIRASATIDAEIFAPQLLRVAAYAAPAALPPWHTAQVWMSCDGSVAVTYGQWQQGDVPRWYGMVWQRQTKGGYKWVLGQTGALAAPLPASDMIAASVADCPPRRTRGSAPPVVTAGKGPPGDYASGHADDRTLEWTTALPADGNRTFTVAIKQDNGLHEVLRATVRADR